MCASVVSHFGIPSPENCFAYDTAYLKPSLPSRDWVLVRVRATGLNRAALQAQNQEHSSPPEFSMFLDKVGDVVTGWAYGGGKRYDGAYPEYAICHKRPGEMKPDSIGYIYGATSSVGIWGILLCKDHGCTVIATASADYVVLEADLEKPETIRNIAPNGVNTVLKIIGLYSLENISMPALAIYGTYVMMGILDKVWSIQDFGARFNYWRRLEKIRTGVYKPEVFLDSTFDLKDVDKAHVRMEANEACEKFVSALLTSSS
ncbi:hypothetical protein K432DRAFT_415230 [Lepidopterella palustris CBS 459.81]|uniref:Uncharacterized protein n=1 Tax=Lepidopterella palustris CBS 459.81 TaxID=1314670 RepID=A0A8E2JHB7_9PEZI|nr:hypothetical protein K432DRAFT_415230 [Lepidopterella palustris CBS 459.81]